LFTLDYLLCGELDFSPLLATLAAYLFVRLQQATPGAPLAKLLEQLWLLPHPAFVSQTSLSLVVPPPGSSVAEPWIDRLLKYLVSVSFFEANSLDDSSAQLLTILSLMPESGAPLSLFELQEYVDVTEQCGGIQLFAHRPSLKKSISVLASLCLAQRSSEGDRLIMHSLVQQSVARVGMQEESKQSIGILYRILCAEVYNDAWNLSSRWSRSRSLLHISQHICQLLLDNRLKLSLVTELNHLLGVGSFISGMELKSHYSVAESYLQCALRKSEGTEYDFSSLLTMATFLHKRDKEHDLDRAEDMFRRCLKFSTTLKSESPEDYIRAARRLARVLCTKHERSLSLEAVDSVQIVEASKHPLLAEAKTLFAEVLALTEALYSSVHGKHREMALSLCDMAMVTDDPRKKVEFNERELSIIRAVSTDQGRDVHLANCLHEFADRICEDSASFQKAHSLYRESISIFENIFQEDFIEQVHDLADTRLCHSQFLITSEQMKYMCEAEDSLVRALTILLDMWCRTSIVNGQTRNSCYWLVEAYERTAPSALSLLLLELEELMPYFESKDQNALFEPGAGQRLRLALQVVLDCREKLKALPAPQAAGLRKSVYESKMQQHTAKQAELIEQAHLRVHERETLGCASAGCRLLFASIFGYLSLPCACNNYFPEFARITSLCMRSVSESCASLVYSALAARRKDCVQSASNQRQKSFANYSL
jgi:hypothetical protein